MTMATIMVPSLEDGVCSVSLDMSKSITGSETEKISCYLQMIRQMSCVDAQLPIDGSPEVVTVVYFASHHCHVPQRLAHNMLCRIRNVPIGMTKVRRKRSHAVRGLSFFILLRNEGSRVQPHMAATPLLAYQYLQTLKSRPTHMRKIVVSACLAWKVPHQFGGWAKPTNVVGWASGAGSLDPAGGRVGGNHACDSPAQHLYY
jgi:hypothetical protein